MLSISFGIGVLAFLLVGILSFADSSEEATKDEELDSSYGNGILSSIRSSSAGSVPF